MLPRVDVVMVGTGEYTTGYGANSAKTDKGAGVVALTMIDLRARGLVGSLHLAGTSGTKMPAIRAHVARVIGDAYPANGYDLAMTTYPGDHEPSNSHAYLAALAAVPRGSAVTVFTPDDTHFDIALACVKAGMHVLVTKPLVKTLAQHHALAAAAREAGVLVAMEVHKRWDPLYSDARDRLRRLGDLSHFSSYMSQPKMQLATFKAWAGISSDISYYLNSHHVDLSEWIFGDRARPVQVSATAACGVAEGELGHPCEDVISVHVVWETVATGSRGTATYTASWIAPPSDVHSQQRFTAMCHKGEVFVDQAHRGFTTATDAMGFASPNPLFMKYTPADGKFVGQSGYGYRSFEVFVRAVQRIRAGLAVPHDFDGTLATVHTTLQGTAILEAGRRSLDAAGFPIAIQYASATDLEPKDMALATPAVKPAASTPPA